jgi:hypothetical protein
VLEANSGLYCVGGVDGRVSWSTHGQNLRVIKSAEDGASVWSQRLQPRKRTFGVLSGGMRLQHSFD